MKGNWVVDKPMDSIGRALWFYSVQSKDDNDMKIRTCCLPECMTKTICDYVVFTGIVSRPMVYGGEMTEKGISNVNGLLKVSVLYCITGIDSLIEKRKRLTLIEVDKENIDD